MEITEHLEALHREGTLLADAAAGTDLSAPVPTCPDWRLRDLLLHTGQVHRWATATVRDGHRSRMDADGERAAWGPEPDDAELVDWFRAGHSALVTTLAAAPADLDCWTVLPTTGPLAFWARRQAHETAVHRFDADAAAGTEGPAVGPALARDGIDELLRGFMTLSRGRVRSDRPRTVLVRATDGDGGEGPGSWLLTVSREPLTVELADDAPAADLTLTGPARDLYLLLWNRLPADAGRVARSGDRSLLDLWRETAVIG
ncbi:maleylpyruvate isomerase family mycothiol-dependent enzyme [Streptomyces sp. BE303]|uniref:maleylpyruvate isomerase family mycothiol-dependent enzyme n=1 Tax=Streptomycetaceae TaxID=2062 RepID=UPI002E7829B2|nr:maleylpyruvate isomerase family mycothiol-dependent enzyme [Streptomyces sp. BE303]MED7950120.1 maleylpyruvate isomerase family mycothiol-dependent enzyme [Streptomyces sp. BE303]